MAYKRWFLIVGSVDQSMVGTNQRRYLLGANVYGLTFLQTPLSSYMQAYIYTKIHLSYKPKCLLVLNLERFKVPRLNEELGSRSAITSTRSTPLMRSCSQRKIQIKKP